MVVFGNLLEKTFSQCYAALMRRFALKNYPVNGFDIVMFNQRVQQELNANIEANSSIFLQNPVVRLSLYFAYVR